MRRTLRSIDAQVALRLLRTSRLAIVSRVRLRSRRCPAELFATARQFLGCVLAFYEGHTGVPRTRRFDALTTRLDGTTMIDQH